jgi:hypothetical protein
MLSIIYCRNLDARALIFISAREEPASSIVGDTVTRDTGSVKGTKLIP